MNPGRLIISDTANVCAALIHDFVFRENIILSMITGVKEDVSLSRCTSHMAKGEGRSVFKLIVWSMVVVMGGVALVYLPPAESPTFPGPAGVMI